LCIYIFSFFFFFFFSSRRRHTRWPRDWSSDVCSSDLIGEIREETHHANKNHKFLRSALYGLLSDCDLIRHWFDFELQAEMRLYPVPWSLTRCCSLHACGLASTLPGLA